MNVYIPTLNRIGKIKTLEFIPDSWKDSTFLVCPPDEVSQHLEYWPNVLPCKRRGIGSVRQWITETAFYEHRFNKMCMLDDDHQFFKRMDPNSTRLTRIDKKEMENLLQRVEDMLQEFAHVGISYRLGNNTMKLPCEENTRYTSSYGHRTDILIKEKIQWDAVPLQEDFHVNLSLLEKGYENRVITEYAYNEFHAANAPGGCSTYRTYDLQKEARDRLVELHHPFVKPVERWTEFTSMLKGSPEKRVMRPETKNRKKTGNMIETTMYGRPESMVYWKKAFNSSQQPKQRGLL